MSGDRPSLRPDEVIPGDGQAPIQARQLLRDTAALLPNLVKLMRRLLGDPRVPRRAKIVLGMAVAYVLSPIDIVPDVIPVIGWADDVVLIMFAIDSLIHRAGPDIVAEHWDGPGDLLELVREVVGISRSLLPKRLRSMIDRLAG